MGKVDDYTVAEDTGSLQEMPYGATRRKARLKRIKPGTLESRMQGNLHVRFGGGPLEKGSDNGLPRWRPTQPEEKIAGRVEETLASLGHTITDGNPEARATLEKLKAMQQDDPDAEVRAACAEAIRSIEAGTQLYGLRRELTKISAARGSLRKETLRRLVHDTGKVNP